MKLGDVVKGKLVMLFRRLVLFARNSGGKFGKVVKEKLVMLFGRLVLFAPNVGRNRGNDNEDKLEPQFEWPYVTVGGCTRAGATCVAFTIPGIPFDI